MPSASSRSQYARIAKMIPTAWGAELDARRVAFQRMRWIASPVDFLAERTGFVCADASGLFDASFASGARIEIGCNMHARRYFVKALDAGDMRAAVAIAAFKAL